MYVAVKGGEKSIENAHKLLAEDRRGDIDIPELSVEQISEQLSLAVSRTMAEGSLYDPKLAALAIKQSGGDMIEATFLLRAYRSTLPRFGNSQPIDTGNMQIERRISASFKDLPGGQILGPTFDYSHRLLDFQLMQPETEHVTCPRSTEIYQHATPRVLGDILENEDLIEPDLPLENEKIQPIGDLTRESIDYPAQRDIRLQNLARADEGFIVSLAYSTMRGYGDNHGFVGELRRGKVSVEITPEELGFSIDIGELEITECETVNQYLGSDEMPPQFTRGYGLAMGSCERKAIAMALVDRALRAQELGEEVRAPAQDEEFVLAHSDSVQASGFVEHIKLPHYGGFQGEVAMVKKLREEAKLTFPNPPENINPEKLEAHS